MAETAGSIVFMLTANASNLKNNISSEMGEAGAKGSSVFGKVVKAGLIGAVAGVGLLVGKAITGGIDSAFKQRKEQYNLQAALGLTPKQSKAAGKAAGSLYSQGYGESAAENKDVVESILSNFREVRNKGSKEIAALSKKAVVFQNAFGTSTSASVKAVGQVVKAGLAKNAEEGFNLLFKTMQKVPKEARGNILSSLKELAPLMKGIGLTGTDAFSAISDWAQKSGGDIKVLVRAVKRVPDRIVKGQSGDALEYLGFNADEVKEKVAQGGEAAKKITQEIFSRIKAEKSKGKKAELAGDIFGSVIGKLGPGRIDGLIDSLQKGGKGFENFGKSVSDADKIMEQHVGFDVFKRKVKQGLIDYIEKHILPLFDKMSDFFDSDSFKGFIEKMKAGFKAIGDFFSQFSGKLSKAKSSYAADISKIGELFSSMAQFVATVWKKYGESFMSIIVTIYETVYEFVGYLIDYLTTLVQFYMAVFNGDWKEAWRLMQKGLSIAIRGITKLLLGLSKIVGKILLLLVTEIFDIVKGLGKGLFKGFVAIMKGLIKIVASGIVSLIKFYISIPGRIFNVLRKLPGQMFNMGKNVIIGFINGIKSMGKAVASTIKHALLDNVIGQTAKKLIIHSPSKLFKGFGKNTMEGYRIGVENESRKTARKFASSFDDVISSGERVINNMDYGHSANGSTAGGNQTYNYNATVQSDSDSNISKFKRMFEEMEVSTRLGLL